MENKLNELLTNASSLFMTYGIKSLTMDDISSRLGMSKKTLYNYVSDKNDLVCKCIDKLIQQKECRMAEVCELGQNAIEELFLVSQYSSEQINEINPSIFFDLKKYHPAAWSLLEESRKNHTLESTKANLRKGISEGLFRDDFSVDAIAQIYLAMVENIFSSSNLLESKMSMAEYHRNMFDYHIRGIANEKGIKLINQSVLKLKPNE